MPNYEVIDKSINGFSPIKIIDGEFKDIEFCYGSVAIEEDQEKDCATLKFDYTILTGEPKNVDGFQETIGDILKNILEEQLTKNEVVYAGGV